MGKKSLDSGLKKLYPPRFIFDSLTRRGCNGIPLNPVVEKVAEGWKEQKMLYFSRKNLIYIQIRYK